MNNANDLADLNGDAFLNFVVEYAYQQEPNISEQNLPVQTAYFVSNFEAEFYNGGIHQFLTNSSGKFATETAESFARIGALLIAALVKKGASLEADTAFENDSIAGEFEELDRKLHDSYPTNENGNIGEQMCIYLQKNKHEVIQGIRLVPR